jgi:hypothetical protein
MQKRTSEARKRRRRPEGFSSLDQMGFKGFRASRPAERKAAEALNPLEPVWSRR